VTLRRTLASAVEIPWTIKDDRFKVSSKYAWPDRVTVAILGLGYVGLPTTLALLDEGCAVVGIDTSEDRLDAIRAADIEMPVEDRAKIIKALDCSNLLLTSTPQPLEHVDAIIICVPTPVDTTRSPDLTRLRHACESVVASARKDQLVILVSTSHVGATRDLLIEPLKAKGLEAGKDIFVAFSPERIDPGNSRFPQRSVPRLVGGATRNCTIVAAALLDRIASRIHHLSSPEAAELAKLHENTFRAVNVALANELAVISSSLGLDVMEIISAATTKPYGFMAFHPGPGVGGQCIPCDPHYLLWRIREAGVPAPLIQQAMTSLAARPKQVVQGVHDVLQGMSRKLQGAKLMVVGVAYKANVSDTRGSPALEILLDLSQGGAVVSYYDPLVPTLTLSDGTSLTSGLNPSGHHYDLIIIHTLHRQGKYDWIRPCPYVLDASYRAAEVAGISQAVRL
jgi:UDP-N-acetyl-D-glucosamine dehydrogenase